jgi:hypothetical protein
VSSLSGEDKGQIAADELTKRLGDVLGDKEGGNNAVNSAGEVCLGSLNSCENMTECICFYRY